MTVLRQPLIGCYSEVKSLNKSMVKKEKIKVTKKKKRIPVPQKPPKVEKNKKAYDRKKEKDEERKIISGNK